MANITVAIYKKKVSELNGMQFYLQVGAQEIDGQLPNTVSFVDDKGVERTCYYDQNFSKQVGHHAYAYEHTAKGGHVLIPPTPIDFNNDIADTKDISSDTTGAERGE